MTKYKRFEGETEKQFIWRLHSLVNTKELTWKQIGDIVNEQFRDSEEDYRDESAYRKPCQSAEAYYDEVFSKMIGTEYSDDIAKQRRELAKERVKLQAEKLEYNRWVREEARDELITEKIVNAISNLSPLKIPDYIGLQSKKSGLLAFTDCHFGVEFCIKDMFGNVINEYSPEIFERRMWDMLNKLIPIIANEELSEIHVWELGDSIAGLLRLNSQLMNLRYGVIDSAIKYAEFLSLWLTELSYYVKIKFQMVKDSNHNQLRLLGQPKNSFPDENMSKVILTFIKERLKDNDNIEIIENDTGFCVADIEGFTILGCHGEVKDLTNCTNSFSRAYGTNIDYVLAGHVHHQTSKETGKHSEVLTVRSMVGTDDYAISLNKTSDVGASFFLFDKEFGKVANFDLKVR